MKGENNIHITYPEGRFTSIVTGFLAYQHGLGYKYDDGRMYTLRKILVQLNCYEPEIPELTLEEMEQLLGSPDSSTRKGIRDLAILTLLYNSGCRIEEFTKIKIGDIDFRAMTVSVVGKGRKHRAVPINKPTMNIIKKYMQAYSVAQEKSQHLLFFNSQGKMLTRPGVTYIIQKYVSRCRQRNPDFSEAAVTPHTFRHSIATHLLEQGVPLIYIRDFLGHESVQTTERYSRTNAAMLKNALEKNSEEIRVEVNHQKVKQDELTALLKKLKHG